MQNKLGFIGSEAKVLRHLDWLGSFQKGPVYPINAEVGVTSKCNLDCADCILKNRNEGGEMDFEQFARMANLLKKGGTKALEITSAEPTLWDSLPMAIALLDDLGFEIGLKSNGLQLNKIEMKQMRMLSWIRISLQGLDQGISPSIEVFPKQTRVSASYVWHKDSRYSILDDISRWCVSRGIRCRIIFSVFMEDFQEIENIRRAIKSEYQSTLFLTQRAIKKAEFCYQPYLHPFLGWDGYLYSCCVFYTPERSHEFDPKYRICKIDDLDTFYKKEPKDLGFRCSKCIYTGENHILASARTHVEDEDFV